MGFVGWLSYFPAGSKEWLGLKEPEGLLEVLVPPFRERPQETGEGDSALGLGLSHWPDQPGRPGRRTDICTLDHLLSGAILHRPPGIGRGAP